jgi:hypothetical protein
MQTVYVLISSIVCSEVYVWAWHKAKGEVYYNSIGRTGSKPVHRGEGEQVVQGSEAGGDDDDKGSSMYVNAVIINGREKIDKNKNGEASRRTMYTSVVRRGVKEGTRLI